MLPIVEDTLAPTVPDSLDADYLRMEQRSFVGLVVRMKMVQNGDFTEI